MLLKQRRRLFQFSLNMQACQLQSDNFQISDTPTRRGFLTTQTSVIQKYRLVIGALRLVGTNYKALRMRPIFSSGPVNPSRPHPLSARAPAARAHLSTQGHGPRQRRPRHRRRRAPVVLLEVRRERLVVLLPARRHGEDHRPEPPAERPRVREHPPEDLRDHARVVPVHAAPERGQYQVRAPPEHERRQGAVYPVGERRQERAPLLLELLVEVGLLGGGHGRQVDNARVAAHRSPHLDVVVLPPGPAGRGERVRSRDLVAGKMGGGGSTKKGRGGGGRAREMKDLEGEGFVRSIFQLTVTNDTCQI